jgi:hypothetical protein
MTIPVLVEQQNGRFTATVLGAPQLRADGSTREEAVTVLRANLSARAASGELVTVELPAPAVPFPDRHYTEEELEAIREMTAEIYRERDEQKRREFPE